MRARHRVAFILVALAGAITFTVTGQEEQQPLPAVTPRAITISLPLEPVVELRTITLADAARANDYVSFDAIYTEAVKRGQPVAAYETLHELWTWSMNDPIGAFYGPELHARLARAYPGYREYIAQYSIVDQRGNTFYPTSETRAFLLAAALEGRTAPRVMVAEKAPAAVTSTRRQTSARRSSESVPAGSRRASRLEAGAPKAAAPVAKVAATAPAPAPVASPDPIITEPPVVITPAPAPAQVKVAEAAPVATVQAPPVTTASIPAPIAPSDQKGSLAGRGLLLVIVGLIGVGLLAVILRTPPEDTITPRRAP